MKVHVFCFHSRIMQCPSYSKSSAALHPLGLYTQQTFPLLYSPYWSAPDCPFDRFLKNSSLHILIRGHGWLAVSFLNPSILIRASDWLTVCVKYEFRIELFTEGSDSMYRRKKKHHNCNSTSIAQTNMSIHHYKCVFLIR